MWSQIIKQISKLNKMGQRKEIEKTVISIFSAFLEGKDGWQKFIKLSYQ